VDAATSVTGAVKAATFEESVVVAFVTVEVTGATADVAASATGCTTWFVAVSRTGAAACVTGAVAAETVELNVETAFVPPEEPERAPVVPPRRPSANAEGANTANRAVAAVTTSARRFMPRP
jgi:hypothetical protein